MKFFGLAILRFNPDTPEPLLLIQSSELSSFGFFQRGYHHHHLTFILAYD
jgi:hypothetical protein